MLWSYYLVQVWPFQVLLSQFQSKSSLLLPKSELLGKNLSEDHCSRGMPRRNEMNQPLSQSIDQPIKHHSAGKRAQIRACKTESTAPGSLPLSHSLALLLFSPLLLPPPRSLEHTCEGQKCRRIGPKINRGSSVVPVWKGRARGQRDVRNATAKQDSARLRSVPNATPTPRGVSTTSWWAP